MRVWREDRKERKCNYNFEKLSQKLNVSESNLSIYRSQFLQVPQFFLKRMEDRLSLFFSNFLSPLRLNTEKEVLIRSDKESEGGILRMRMETGTDQSRRSNPQYFVIA